jgi:uncharacterized membrane protein
MQDAWFSSFSKHDWIALTWFFAAWLGYGPAVQAIQQSRSIVARMRGVRRAWMHSMLGRDNRITDASLLGSSMSSATFFASTTMLAFAALLGVLTHFGPTYEALQELSFTARTSRALAEAKVLLLVIVFGHNFMKLTWALRQMNYCLALIGAAPLKPDAAKRLAIADRVSGVLTLAMGSFNSGIRGYYLRFLR